MNSTLPVFRSPQQLRILGHLLIHAGRAFTIPELVAATGASQPTVWREVGRLGRAGIVEVTRTGRSQVVKANESSPYFSELRSLSLKLVGPAMMLGGRLESVAGVEEAFVFGSWAARYEGVTGTAPGDIDVLVVGTADPDEVETAVEPLEASFGASVNPVVVPREEWNAARSGFLRQVKKGPLVRVSKGPS